ncbi:tripartite motif-containing protein 2-like [Lytechinus pictus]|uniref:tripartite motif-containing protein 2-like n=1 Tax=Lytechinus pictus TaxID=7653 RepID=UPI0030B9BADD
MADAMNAISQSMECPVCLSTFTDPKILSCSHTFCKTCLDNLLECHGNCQIRCPICRAVTQVPNQDVGKLQTNLALKNVIEDMKCHPQICTNCKSNDRPSAVVFCQDCGKYLCTSCLNMHSQWGDFIGHDVIAMSEISSGNVSVRRYRKCRKHPKEDEECFCSTCRRFTCFRCVVMEHKDEGHQVIEAAAYEDKHMKSIEYLKSKVDKKQSCFQKYIDFIDEQMKSVDNAKKQCTSDINIAYDEAVRQLTEKREILLRDVKGTAEGVEKELENMKRLAQKHINQLTTIAEMVTNRTKIPFDMDTLAAHDTLCEELLEGFDQEDPDYEQPRKSSKKGKSVSFERNIGKDELGLGQIVNVVVKNFILLTQDSMNALVSTPDGRMAVGCNPGGVNIFSADGQLQQTVLKDIEMYGVGFLSDGRCVVIDTSNNITLYTPEYTKFNVMFQTLSNDEGGFSNLTVDGDDLIYVSYRKAEKIQVFSTAGGQAVREIPCNGYEPQQITSYHGSLITSSDDTIRSIDKEGAVQHELKKGGSFLYAAVSQGNTILIAEVKHNEDLVRIDEYTNELRHIRNLVNDFKIEKPKRYWCYLQQYRSGEIAFCIADRLYIFH